MIIAIKESRLFARIDEVLGNTYDLQNTGTGAPGLLLERLLGVEANNADLPDAGGWEIKFHGGTALLTLFHLNPSPKTAIKTLINKHGWTGKDGRRCFRHTISGGPTERGFYVVNDTVQGRLAVKHDDGTEAYWTHDAILNAASSKMRRLIMVSGRKKKENGRQQVQFQSAVAYTDFKPTLFAPAAQSGLVKIDFDARYQNGKRDSEAIRDHGTKFRIKASDLNSIYGRQKRFDE